MIKVSIQIHSFLSVSHHTGTIQSFEFVFFTKKLLLSHFLNLSTLYYFFPSRSAMFALKNDCAIKYFGSFLKQASGPMMRNPIIKWTKEEHRYHFPQFWAKYAHEMGHAFIYYPQNLHSFRSQSYFWSRITENTIQKLDRTQQPYRILLKFKVALSRSFDR